MTDLKSQLQSDVIDVLREPERAKKFGLSLPNGLLFYGPPGCGKTYFAEKFAEEVGCNYIYVRCSDVASPYIHGGQGKIAALFDDARKQAPAIIFLDEIELMLRDRSKQDNASMAGEVNEFLTHLNNCGKEGIIVIGASNKPTDIDKAAIRSGRLEYKYYIPLPDLETRSELFRIHLKSREVDENLDYDRLAAITENFSSSDITLIAEKAGREVFRNRQECITMPILEEVISISKPTVSAADLKAYEAIRDEFEGRTVQVERKRIGFK
jgi:transitional endoplasmic reticulum ATPase